MNKHRQILEVLKVGDQAPNPRDFKLYIRGHAVEDRTWASAQELNPGEVLDLWLRLPRPRSIPRISVESGSPTHTDEEDSNAEDSWKSASLLNDVLSRLSRVPVVVPFLGWRVIDEFEETEECALEEQTNRFLLSIYQSLPAECTAATTDQTFMATTAEQVYTSRGGTWAKLSVQGKKEDEVKRSAFSRRYRVHQELFQESRRLWAFFIPPHGTAPAPVRLFWGLLYMLIEQPVSHHLRLSDLVDRLRYINTCAERIHLGVHYRRAKKVSPEQITYEDVLTQSSILLTSMVKALTAIFNMFIMSVREARTSQGKALSHRRTASTFGDEALDLMQTARDQLIAESNVTMHSKRAGAVPSPEGLVILLMERLVRGVFRTGTVDLMKTYGGCMERLVSPRLGRKALLVSDILPTRLFKSEIFQTTVR